MASLWYILLFVFKWIFIGLIYFVLFILVRAVQYEMNTQAKGLRSQRPAGVPGRLEVIQKSDHRKAQIPIGRIFNLQIETNIGSDSANDIVLDEQTISGRHAHMSWDGAGWWVEDLGSKNGSLVNNQRCPPHKEQQLPFGATLSLGGMAFKLRKE